MTLCVIKLLPLKNNCAVMKKRKLLLAARGFVFKYEILFNHSGSVQITYHQTTFCGEMCPN